MQQLRNLIAKRKLLLLSILVNACLLAACAVLLSELKKVYTEYRHFRSLPIGNSLATDASRADNSVVLFGDSRIETWYPDPESDKYTFINAGVTGETTTEMRRRFERDVVALQPDYVVIQAGVNDLTASVTKGIKQPETLIDTMHQNLQYFITALEKQNIDVIVTSILPAKHLSLTRKVFWHDELTGRINRANTELKINTEAAGADWLDLDPLYLDDAGNPMNKLYFDTLHINHDGYRALNSHLKNYIDNL